MNREEAAQMLKRLKYDYQNGADENDCFYDMYLYALDTAITILTSPWVKTAGRLPTEADADRKLNVFVWTHSGGHVVNYQRVIESPDFYPWWTPIMPPLEVEK